MNCADLLINNGSSCLLVQFWWTKPPNPQTGRTVFPKNWHASLGGVKPAIRLILCSFMQYPFTNAAWYSWAGDF